MLCEDCNEKEATVHRTKFINGIKEETHLCSDCAKKNEVFNFDEDFSISSFLSNLLEENTPKTTSIGYGQNIQCPGCGFTYNDFKSVGRLGCNLCYSTFHNMLNPLIKKIQTNNTHIGKIPRKSGAAIKLHKALADLKEQLKLLIIKEEFEEAAKIRDKIKEIEQEIEKE